MLPHYAQPAGLESPKGSVLAQRLVVYKGEEQSCLLGILGIGCCRYRFAEGSWCCDRNVC